MVRFEHSYSSRLVELTSVRNLSHQCHENNLFRQLQELFKDKECPSSDEEISVKDEIGLTFKVKEKVLFEKYREILERKRLKYTLESADGQHFVVEGDVAKMFEAVKDYNAGGPMGDLEGPLPMPDTNGDVVSIMVEWAKRHVDVGDPRDDDREEDPNIEVDRDTECIEIWDDPSLLEPLSPDVLFRLVMAAGQWQLKGLLRAAIKRTAALIKGKTSNEMHRIFNLGNIPLTQWQE